MKRHSKLHVWYLINVCRVIRACFWLGLPEVCAYWVADVSRLKPGMLASYRAGKVRLVP